MVEDDDSDGDDGKEGDVERQEAVAKVSDGGRAGVGVRPCWDWDDSPESPARRWERRRRRVEVGRRR